MYLVIRVNRIVGKFIAHVPNDQMHMVKELRDRGLMSAKSSHVESWIRIEESPHPYEFLIIHSCISFEDVLLELSDDEKHWLIWNIDKIK